MANFGYTILGFGASSGTPPTELGIASNANNLNIKTLTWGRTPTAYIIKP